MERPEDKRGCRLERQRQHEEGQIQNSYKEGNQQGTAHQDQPVIPKRQATLSSPGACIFGL